MKSEKEGEKMKLNKRYLLVISLITIFLVISLVYASTFVDKLQTDFNRGTYNQTNYNTTTNAVQINLSFNNGTYTSQIFNTGSNVSLNNLSWTYQRIQCPGNMSFINKLNGYCIDQYEASMPSANSTTIGNSSDVARIANPGTMMAVSQPGVVPWVSVNQTSSRIACANAGKHLCTDEEWLGAANVQGRLYDLPTNLNVAPYYCVTDSATYCPAGSSYSNGNACNTGKNKTGGVSSCVSSEGVYDMTGNVWEWTNETVGYTNPVGEGWRYWNGTVFTTSGAPGTAKYGNDGVYFLAGTQTSKAVFRGGSWNPGADDGPFSADLDNAPSATGSNVGFRCCSS